MGILTSPYVVLENYHTKAFVDCFKSCIWHHDAAKILYKLIDVNATGIYNIGLEKNSIYDFVKQKNINILREYKDNISENIPNDISMNIDKLKNTINDTTI